MANCPNPMCEGGYVRPQHNIQYEGRLIGSGYVPCPTCGHPNDRQPAATMELFKCVLPKNVGSARIEGTITVTLKDSGRRVVLYIDRTLEDGDRIGVAGDLGDVTLSDA